MNQRSRTEYSLLNIATGVGGYILSVILSLVNRIVFTRCLPAEYLGISGLFGNVLSMLSLAELGIGGAIVYALYKPLAENDEKKIAALVQLFGKAYRIIGIVIGTAGLCVIPFLDLIIGQQPQIAEDIRLIYVIYLFNTTSSYFFTYRSTLLVAAQKNYLVTGLNYVIICVQAIVQAAFLFFTRHYIGYLLIQVIFTLIYNLWISRIAAKQYPYITQKDVPPLALEEKKTIFRDVRDLTVYKLSGVLVNGTDNIIITFFSGLATTGLASNYTLLVNTLNSLLSQVFGGITSSVGNLNAVESHAKKVEIFHVANLMNFWLFSWFTVGIVYISGDLVQLLFGHQYVLDISIPLIMAVNFYTVGMQNAIWTFKHTMGLFRHGRFLQMGTAALNLILSIFLGHIWGLFGILFATFLSRLFTNLWYDPYVIYKHAFGLSPLSYLKKYTGYLIVLLLNVAVCGFFMQWFPAVTIFSVLIKVSLISAICNCIFFIVFRNRPEWIHLRQILRNAISSLGRFLKPRG